MQKDKMVEKLAKLKALVERGVGGEKETARRMYEELKEKYGISEETVAAVEEQTVEEVKEDFSSIAFALYVLSSNLEEEIEMCKKCQFTQGSRNCTECGTEANRKDLEAQYEYLKRKIESDR